MIYREEHPLSNAIDAIWMLDVHHDRLASLPYRTLPDGCVDLIYCLKRDAAGTVDSAALLAAVHNLDSKPQRHKALQEMLRVLKPGGSILLNDIVNRNEYRQELTRLGLADVRVVVASKCSDAFSGAVSFGSFRPATVVARLKGEQP